MQHLIAATKQHPIATNRRRNVGCSGAQFREGPAKSIHRPGWLLVWCPAGVMEPLRGVEGESSPLSGLGMEAAELLHP